MAANPLQRRQHLDNRALSCIERLAQDQFALIERGEPLFGLSDFVFYGTDPVCSLDQLLVELAPVFADRFNAR